MSKREAEMTDIYEVFSKELDASVSHEIEFKLGGNVFSQTEVRDIDLLVGREEQAKSLARGLLECFNGSKNKIILHGLRGVGKSSHLVLLREREAKEKDTILIEVSPYLLVEEVKSARSYLLHVVVSKLLMFLETKRETKERDLLREKLVKLLVAINRERDIGKFRKTISDLGFLPEDSQNKSDADLLTSVINEICDQCKCDKKIILIIDDFHKFKKLEMMEFVSSIIQKTKIIPLLILPSGEYNSLDETFLKNAFALEIPLMKDSELMGILRKRIIEYREPDKKINKNSDKTFEIDILPFQKNTLEYISSLSGGLPLTFISKAEAAYTVMFEQEKSRVTPEMARIKPTYPTTISARIPRIILTEKERMVFSVMLKSVDGIKTKEIQALIKENEGLELVREYLTMLLSRLIKKGAVRKERVGRFVLYFPMKDVEIV